MAVNLRGVFLCCKRAIGEMIDAGADRRGPRPGDQHLLPARDDRPARPRRLRHQQGRRRQPHPPAGRRLRPPRDPRQRRGARQDHHRPGRRWPIPTTSPTRTRARRSRGSVAPRTSPARRRSWPPTTRSTCRAPTCSSTAAGWRTDGGGSRAAVLGAGWIAESHVAHIQAADDAELVAVCDLDPAASAAIAEPLGATRARRLGADAGARSARRAVGVHAAAAPSRADDRGPGARDPRLPGEADRPRRAPTARRSWPRRRPRRGLRASDTCGAAPNCWSGCARRSASGEVAMLVSRNYGPTAGRGWFMDRAQSGGQILERASHHIDLQRAIAGDVAAVQASGRRRGARAVRRRPGAGIEDALAITLQFAGGAAGDDQRRLDRAGPAPRPCAGRARPSGHDLAAAGSGRFELSGRAGGEAGHRQLRRSDAPLGAAVPRRRSQWRQGRRVLHAAGRAGHAEGGGRLRGGAGRRR